MNQLCIDTSSELLIVTLSIDGNLGASRSAMASRQTLLLLHQFMGETLTEAGLRPSDIDSVACVSGPGSFTGLRIGGAAVKSFSDAVNCPVVSIPTLWMYSLQLECSGSRIALLESVRDEVYFSRFDQGVLPSIDAPVNYLTREQLKDELETELPEDSAIVYALKDKTLLAENSVVACEYRPSPALLTKAASLSSLRQSAIDFNIQYHRPSQPELRFQYKDT